MANARRLTPSRVRVALFKALELDVYGPHDKSAEVRGRNNCEAARTMTVPHL